MAEKEPTQPKIDEKTQQRLAEIDAELFEFKKKAKGDAKANLKLVEMERAKELILEKRELLGGIKEIQEVPEGRDAKEFINQLCDWFIEKGKATNKDDWEWKVSRSDLIDLCIRETKVPDEYIDREIKQKKVILDEFNNLSVSGRGIDALLVILGNIRVHSIAVPEGENNNSIFLEIVQEKIRYKELSKDGEEIIVDGVLHDSSDEACLQFGVRSGDRISVPAAYGLRATVIGVHLDNIYYIRDGQTKPSWFGDEWRTAKDMDRLGIVFTGDKNENEK